jgi:hypothetical protein
VHWLMYIRHEMDQEHDRLLPVFVRSALVPQNG